MTSHAQAQNSESWNDDRAGMFVHWGLYSATWAADLAQTAKDAGMEYIVITAKHHDGFTLFNSTEYWSTGASHIPAKTANPYGGTNISPPSRDLMLEFVTAVRAQGLKVGFYYSVIDWQHPNA